MRKLLRLSKYVFTRDNTEGMVGDIAPETDYVALVDRCDYKALIKNWLTILLFTSASCKEKHMPENHKKTIDFCK